MLGFENSIEIAEVAPRETPRKPFWRTEPSPDEMPIREATRAETRKLSAQPAPHDGERDAFATRHNLYTEDKRSTRVYYSDYQQKTEVMRANAKEITTKQDDRQTVAMMLDLAQSKGWQTIKLNGTDSFRREAFIEAYARGIGTEGYQPKPTDMQEVARRRAAVAPEAPGASAQAQAPAQKPATKPSPKAIENGSEIGFWETQLPAQKSDTVQASQSRGMRM